jgi:hypothetical protein
MGATYRIGTNGWMCNHLGNGDLYPPGLPELDCLVDAIASFAYFRFHGSGQADSGSYPDDESPLSSQPAFLRPSPPDNP